MRWLNDEQIPAFPFLLFILVLRRFIPPPPREGLCRISRCFNPCFPFCSGGFLTIQMLGGGSGQALTVPLGSPVQQVGGTDEKWGRSCSDIS